MVKRERGQWRPPGLSAGSFMPSSTAVRCSQEVDMPTYTTTTMDAGKRLDVVLTAALKRGRREIQEMIRSGAVTQDGHALKPHTPVKSGASFTYLLPKKVRQPKRASQTVPVEILYEDQELLAVNKPAGFLVHPTRPNSDETTLIDAVVSTR